jgi:imidazolonepropionase-like amidohydrolase
MGGAGSTAIPPGAKILDLTDHTVFPGIVGMHDHMFTHNQ